MTVPDPPLDKFAVVAFAVVAVVKYLVMGTVAVIIAVLWGLPRLAGEIAGKDTALAVSLYSNLGWLCGSAGIASTVGLFKWNVRLRGRIRELSIEAEPSSIPGTDTSSQ